MGLLVKKMGYSVFHETGHSPLKSYGRYIMDYKKEKKLR